VFPSAIDIADLADDFTRNPSQLLGIPFALLGAVFLSLGAQLQHRGVAKVESSSGTDATSGLNLAQLLALLGRPSWVTGTVMLGLAIVLQLGSLSLAPITLVQPLGAVALVITAVVNSRISGVRLNRRSVVAIVACVGGVGLFVTIAAIFTGEHRITESELITILVMLGAVLLAFGLGFVLFRTRFTAIFYIVGTGVLYGFVATLAKVIIGRLQQGVLRADRVLLGPARPRDRRAHRDRPDDRRRHRHHRVGGGEQRPVLGRVRLRRGRRDRRLGRVPAGPPPPAGQPDAGRGSRSEGARDRRRASLSPGGGTGGRYAGPWRSAPQPGREHRPRPAPHWPSTEESPTP
jgi:hypothetical protein